MRYKIAILSIFFFAAFAFTANEASAQRPTRINFSRGTTSSIVGGVLNGRRSTRVYLLKVRAGQRLKIEQLGNGSRPISIFIQAPDGSDAGDMDLSCHNRYDISPTSRGDYKLTVQECEKADAWRGNYRFRVSVR